MAVRESIRCTRKGGRKFTTGHRGSDLLPLPVGLGALPACGSRIVFVHMQLNLEKVERLPGGLPACSSGMGEFHAIGWLVKSLLYW